MCKIEQSCTVDLLYCVEQVQVTFFCNKPLQLHCIGLHPMRLKGRSVVHLRTAGRKTTIGS